MADKKLGSANAFGEFAAIIRRARTRLRLRLSLRGLIVVLGAGLVIVLLASLVLDHFRFADSAVTATRAVTYMMFACLCLVFLGIPLVRRLPDERMALYLEEHEPSLDAVMVSAVEADRAEPRIVSAALAAKLPERALEASKAIDYGRRIERDNLRRSTFALAGLVAAGVLVALWSPDFIQHGFRFLLFPWSSEAQASPYQITVEPGDITVVRGSDQAVTSQIVGFGPERVELAVKEADGEWRRRPMRRTTRPGEHESFLFNLDQAVDYFVEAEGVRSASYHIDVVDRPSTKKLTLEYRYPAYTGLNSRTVDDGGDITGPSGTRVKIRVQPTIPVPGGEIVLNEQERLPLEADASGEWAAEIEIARDGVYRVQLQASNGTSVNASPEYAIESRDEQPPMIKLSQPGRDTKVTRVEEPRVEVTAKDDYDLERVELVLSVNGGPEKPIRLGSEAESIRELKAGHTLYLEDISLEPGDLITYYARALDRAADGERRESSTDIFFMEVRPFRRDYHRADGMGGGGQGQGDDQGNLSAQQRQLLAATFKLVRDRRQYSDAVFHQNLDTLAQAENKIRARAQAIVRRLAGRNIQADTSLRTFAAELSEAIVAMRGAEAHLRDREPEPALPPARKALQHLQRADAAFRDVRVSLARQSGGQGRNREAEELADLFKLEMDKLRNQYENVQWGQPPSEDQAVDEILERLRELARRQQKEKERMRRRAAQNQSGSGGGSAQREMAEEVEKLARQLQRLTRKQPNPELDKTLQALQAAAEAMKRAAASGEPQQGMQSASSAEERLREARRLLDQSRSTRLAQDVDKLQRRAERLANQQRDIEQNVKGLPIEGDRRDQQVSQLVQAKESMEEEIRNLERELNQLAQATKGKQADTARKLAEAGNTVRQNRLPEKIRESRQVIRGGSPGEASPLEENIRRGIDEMRGQIGEAATSIGESRSQQLAQTLEQVRDLVRDMESLGERLSEGNEQESPGPGQQSPSGQEQGANQGGRQQRAGDPREAGRGQRYADQSGVYDTQQLPGEFAARRGEAQRLRSSLRAQGIGARDIDALVDQLQTLEQQATEADITELARLQAEALEQLKLIEYALRQNLEPPDEHSLTLSNAEDVPAGFRALVEKYYRALSESP